MVVSSLYRLALAIPAVLSARARKAARRTLLRSAIEMPSLGPLPERIARLSPSDFHKLLRF